MPTSFILAQTIGDYRSAQSGSWSTSANWERLTVLPDTWSSAIDPPDINTPSITIRSGNTITVKNEAVGGNNITVENNGVFAIDITTTSAFQFSGNNVNYGTISWINGVINFTTSNVSITNHGLFDVSDVSGNANMLSPGTITNASDGTFNFTTNAGIIVNANFVNQGLFSGKGSITFNSSFQNQGIISPAGDGTVGTLRFESSNTSLQTGSAINIDIVDGSGEGTGSDLVFFNTDRPFFFTSTILNINDHPTAPIMKYIVIRTNDFSNNFNGPFASYSVPPAYDAPVIEPTNVYINKTAITVPLTFGDFYVKLTNGKPFLYWTTLQESNTAYFDIERSTDGILFTQAARVKANGNTSYTSSYHFVDGGVLSANYYYYRLKEVDADGLFTYSPTCFVKIVTPEGQFKILNSVVKDNMEVVTVVNGKAIITDVNGKILLSLSLASGLQQVDLSKLSSGIYNIRFIGEDGKVTIARIVKL